MRSVLSEVVKFTGGLGFIETVLVTGDNKTTTVEAMDNDRSVIVKCKLNEALPELEGKFGVTNLSILQGALNYANFKDDAASLTVGLSKVNNAPDSFIFEDSQGQKFHFRLMRSDLVPEQPKFLGGAWDVSFKPQRSKLKEFAEMSSLLSNLEPYFQVKTVGDELRFYLGDEESATHNTFLIMHRFTDEEKKAKKTNLPDRLYWPVSQVLSVLKLGNDENTVMSFNGKGALEVEITTSIATYKYIFPSKKL